MKLPFVTLALLLAALPALAAPPPDRLAFMGLTGGAGFSRGELGTLEEMFLNALQRSGPLRVVGLTDIAALVGVERTKQLAGCESDTSCIAEMAGSLGVELVASANVGRLGGLVVVALKVVDARKAAVVARAERRLKDAAGLPDAIDAMAQEVVTALHVATVPTPPARPAWPLVLAAGGAVTVLVGGILGLRARGAMAGDTVRTASDGVREHTIAENEAISAGNAALAANVCFAAGGILLASGGIGWFVAAPASASGSGGEIGLGGRF